MTATALSAAFAKAGGPSQRVVWLMTQATKFHNMGGTAEEWAQVGAIAFQELSSEGRGAGAGNGHHAGANARQPNDGKAGHVTRASNGPAGIAPSPSPKADGSGLQLRAGNGQIAAAAPAREPTPSQREASKQVAFALASYDREYTRTGKRWGSVTYRELFEMAFDGDLGQELLEHIGVLEAKDRDKTIRELVSPQDFTQILRKVRKP